MRQSGLTLIELMIIAAVIGILAMVSIPLYLGYLQTSRVNVVRQNMEMLALAEDNYFYEFNTYRAGTYDPDGVDTLRAALGWDPRGDEGEFVYNVQACGAGTIATCFTITVTGFDGKVTDQLTRQ
jgi:Tfp pilus assembly protein PilE